MVLTSGQIPMSENAQYLDYFKTWSNGMCLLENFFADFYNSPDSSNILCFDVWANSNVGKCPFTKQLFPELMENYYNVFDVCWANSDVGKCPSIFRIFFQNMVKQNVFIRNIFWEFFSIFRILHFVFTFFIKNIF